MKRRVFDCAAVCCVAFLGTIPAFCQQTPAKPDTAAKPSKQTVKLYRNSSKAKKAARGQAGEVILTAQGNPSFVEFTSLCTKRGDLAAERTKLGVDAAFTKWMREERPVQYDEYLKDRK
jgi:hypothetical protein